MKILYLITKAERGGAQSVVADLLRAHKERGDSVVLVSGNYGYLIDESKTLGFEAKVLSSLGNTFNPFSIYKTYVLLRRFAKKISPDIVSCHSSFAGIVGRIALGRRYKTIFTAHGIAFTQGAPLWRKPVAILAEFVASRFCEKIIAVSENDKKTMKRFLLLGDKKIVTVHNGVDVPVDISFPKKDHFSITFIGRLVLPKNPFILIDALDILKRGGDKMPHLHIVGNGKQFSDLEKMTRDLSLGEYVTFEGECDKLKVRSILRETSLFVLPTKWEGFPITILEAMAEGCAVLASDVGGIKEAVKSEVGVLLPRCANAEVWANNIKKILMNKESLDRMQQSAYMSAKNNFSKGMMIEKTFKIYDDVVGK